VAGRETQSRAIVFEDGQAIRLRLLLKSNAQALRLRELFGKIVILAKEMPVILPRILFPADGFDDVLAIEHADEPIDPRHIRQQLRLVPLHETPGNDDALALA
jgi:hypothetical protein